MTIHLKLGGTSSEDVLRANANWAANVWCCVPLMPNGDMLPISISSQQCGRMCFIFPTYSITNNDVVCLLSACPIKNPSQKRCRVFSLQRKTAFSAHLVYQLSGSHGQTPLFNKERSYRDLRGLIVFGDKARPHSVSFSLPLFLSRCQTELEI